MKNDSDSTASYDGLRSSYQELKSQFEQQEIDLEPHPAIVVKESLNLPIGKEPVKLPDTAEFGFDVANANRKAYGLKRLQALLVGGMSFENHYLGMINNKVGIPDESKPNRESIFVFKVEEKDRRGEA